MRGLLAMAALCAALPTTPVFEVDAHNIVPVWVASDKQEVGGWAVRSYLKPFANWIWGGCLMMALGGFLSLSDRRHRVAAGARPTQGQPHEN